MSSHMARRSCVTILLQKGMPPTTIMKLTVHKDLKTPPSQSPGVCCIFS
ncbi:MAG: hypothetical protein ACQERS_08155 [Bacteroidota bacterium]